MTQFSPYDAQDLEVYTNGTSVRAGDVIQFHISVKLLSHDRVSMKIFRLEQANIDRSDYGGVAALAYKQDYRQRISIKEGEKPYQQSTIAPPCFPVPPDASQGGCRWPPASYWAVPPETQSGIFVAQFSYREATAYALFVVKPAGGADKNRILCQLSVNTYQAYNPWGGYCLYYPPISLGFVNPVSFDRPCQLWDFILYEAPIVGWLRRNAEVDFCTNVDLHADAALLADYRLFISCGHDEYWSKTMRARVEAFGESGGNVMFLSGNTCYRPVEFVDSGCRIMRRVSLESGDLGTPESFTTGVDWSAGRWSKPLPKRGYVVKDAGHWLFAGTGLKGGDVFGEAEGIIGYETDAAHYDSEGSPTAPTPADFVTVASAKLADWEDWYGRDATCGLFQRKGSFGTVLTVGTTGWGQGLLQDRGHVHRITKNAIDVLGGERGVAPRAK